MLNISDYSVSDQIRVKDLKTLSSVESKKSSRVLLRLMKGTFVIGVLILLLPWTQNIRSNGTTTTLNPDQRPQSIHSVIPGRIEKWYVKEGDFVQKGDTIAFMSEVKAEYFDSQLLDRTTDQTEFKKLSVTSYEEKINNLDKQITALTTQKKLKLDQGQIKLQQAKLKVTNDSIVFYAADVTYQTARKQYDRLQELFDQGLKSRTDLENRNIKLQDSYSYLIKAENDLLASKSDLIAAKIELSNIQMNYETSVAKARSDKFSAVSSKLQSQGDVSKLENQFSNYEKRNSFYYILAPQDCYVTKLIANGIGETVKEGAAIVNIMPTQYQMAAEIYVDPIDLPLVKIGSPLRLQFDGWPAVVFSGWPNISQGTYGAKVYAIDQYISPNGKYRLLVEQDPDDYPWPDALRFGGGVHTMILLEDVPIWYELWRKINGFPPNYYMEKAAAKTAENK